MNRMKLYSSKTSPYSRKVRVVVQELGLGDRVEEIFTDPFDPPPEFLAANPLSRIPALVNDHGQAIVDSSLIVDYLQTRGRGMPALPRGNKRWEVLRRREIAEGLIDAAIAIVFEKRRPESIIYTSFLDRQTAVIHRCADSLNLDVAELAAGNAGIVEITTAVALAYIDFRLPYIEWRKGRPALSDWHAAFAQRPSMLATQPPAA